MDKNDSTYFTKKKFNKRMPYYLVLMGCIIPICVTIHKSLQTKRLESGVSKDIKRIQDKGKKFSDIPKSF